jgi:hypothetical protein
MPEHKHSYQLKERNPTLNKDDHVLLFRCKYCPRICLVFSSEFWRMKW